MGRVMNEMKINTDPSSQLSAQKMKSKQKELSKVDDKFKDLLKNKDRKGLEEAAKDFEELFLNMIFKNMRNSVLKSDLVEKSHEREMWEGMLDEAYSESIAESGSFGIAKMIMDSFEPYLEGDKIKEPNGSIDLKA